MEKETKENSQTKGLHLRREVVRSGGGAHLQVGRHGMRANPDTLRKEEAKKPRLRLIGNILI